MIGAIQIIDLTSRPVLDSYTSKRKRATDYTDVPRSKENAAIRANPWLVSRRPRPTRHDALVAALEDYLTKGVAPPASRVPSIAAGHRKLDNPRGHSPHKSADRRRSRIRLHLEALGCADTADRGIERIYGLEII